MGSGSGALGTLEALRESGFKGTITLIGNEGYNPIDRTKLSKALIDDPSKILLRDDAWFKDGAVDVVSDEVTGVDFGAKKVATKSGSSYQYTKLVLATGGTPKSLPLPGFKELGNIFLLRNIPHVKAINAAIGEGKKKIVIIGSSFIGKCNHLHPKCSRDISLETNVPSCGVIRSKIIVHLFWGLLHTSGCLTNLGTSTLPQSPANF